MLRYGCGDIRTSFDGWQFILFCMEPDCSRPQYTFHYAMVFILDAEFVEETQLWCRSETPIPNS